MTNEHKKGKEGCGEKPYSTAQERQAYQGCKEGVRMSERKVKYSVDLVYRVFNGSEGSGGEPDERIVEPDWDDEYEAEEIEVCVPADRTPYEVAEWAYYEIDRKCQPCPSLYEWNSDGDGGYQTAEIMSYTIRVVRE